MAHSQRHFDILTYLSHHHHNSGNEQTCHPKCFQCPFCPFFLPFPSNPRSAFCHLKLVCVLQDFTYMESYISCTFQLASFAPSNYSDSHPCLCVSMFQFISFFPPPSFLPPSSPLLTFSLFLFLSFFLFALLYGYATLYLSIYVLMGMCVSSFCLLKLKWFQFYLLL